MAPKQHLSPLEQRDGFRKAFETYRQYLDADNFIGAYVVAFSIFEDRVSTMYLARHYVEHGADPDNAQEQWKPLSVKLRLLCEHCDISADQQTRWLDLAQQRNRKVHAAMWRLDEFQRADAEAVLSIAREADALRKAQKKKHRR